MALEPEQLTLRYAEQLTLCYAEQLTQCYVEVTLHQAGPKQQLKLTCWVRPTTRLKVDQLDILWKCSMLGMSKDTSNKSLTNRSG